MSASHHPAASPSSGHGSVRERMAQQARAKPTPPPAKRWLWVAVLGVGAAIALAQLLGLTTSPVEQKMRRGRGDATQPRGPSAPVAEPRADGSGPDERAPTAPVTPDQGR